MWLPFRNLLRIAFDPRLFIHGDPINPVRFWWLTGDERQAVDQLASVYAMRLYSKPLDQLTAEQAAHVIERAKSRQWS